MNIRRCWLGQGGTDRHFHTLALDSGYVKGEHGVLVFHAFVGRLIEAIRR